MWIRLTPQQVPDFPQFDLHYLRRLTLGPHQDELAPSYVQDKFDHESTDIFQLDRHRHFPGLLRFRIYSRFRNVTRYQIWIAFLVDRNDGEGDVMLGADTEEDVILGYYCTCKTGAKTLGCCAYIASILWFLAWARHQQYVKYPSRALLNYIEDAGNRNLDNDGGRREELIVDVRR